MKKILSTTLFIASALSTFGQTVQWETTVRGADAFVQATALATGPDSSCYVAATSKQHETSEDASLTRYAADGTRLWTRIVDLGGRDHADGLVVDSSGNVYLLGTSEVAGLGTETVVTKYTAAGGTAWTRSFGAAGAEDDNAVALALSPTGGVVVAGNRWSGTNFDPFVTRIDASGNIAWQHVVASDVDEESVGIVGMSNGYAGLLFKTTRANNTDAAVLRLSPTGAPTWTTHIGDNGPLGDVPQSIAITSTNRIIVGLSSFTPETRWDYLVVRVNVIGGIDWQRRYDNGQRNDFLKSVAVDSTDKPIVTGSTSITRSDYDFGVLKLRGDGTVFWFKTFGASSNLDDVPAMVQHAGTNKAVVVGTARTADGNRHFGAALYSPSGTLLTPSFSFGRSAYSYEGATVTAVSPDGALYVIVQRDVVQGLKCRLVRFML
ncbi:MAG: hypothetical protein ACAH95_11315 [Fimbriimonas sp.]